MYFLQIIMNFAKAVRGNLCRAGAIKAIQDQAQTELSRTLHGSELDLLFNIFSPNGLVENILKVIILKLLK